MRRNLFAMAWIAATLGIGWQVAHGQRQFQLDATLLLILACTVLFIWWLTGPSVSLQTGPTRRGRLTLLVLVLVLALFGLRDIAGPPLLYGLPVVAVVVLLVLRPRLERRDVIYAAGLAVAAAVAALGMSWAKFSVPVWSALQLALVATCLLAGWSLLGRSGLLQAGLGRSLILTEGWPAAVIPCAQAILLAMPWALYNVAMGGSNNDAAVRQWWQPLVAIQPGIAEEAWGRVFMVALLYVILRRVAADRTALTAAVFVAAYWFAYLHTAGGFRVSSLLSTLLIGTLYSLPISYLWLRRGLEPAMAFHFWIDFIRFGVAYLISAAM